MILASGHPGGMLLVLASALAYALSAALRGGLAAAAPALVLVGWLLHAAAIGWGLFVGAPRFGFAPALSVTAWLVLGVYGIERRFFPALQGQALLAGLGAGTVLLAFWFPGTPLHAAASPWLPLHLALAVASYGLFATAVVHAGLMSRAERQMRSASVPGTGLPLLTLERLTFRFVAAGFVLLSATLLAGWFFGEQLYGGAGASHAGSHRVRWDHKTVFSVLSWCTFAALLLGRSRFGWRGPAAIKMLYVGAGFLLLSYIGSRFVLEVILGRAS